ncbi:MAG: hypothetical protein RLZZ502_1595 [Pseudomonadota bacterium]
MSLLMLLLGAYPRLCHADAASGARLFHTREGAHCVLCHQVGNTENKSMGNIGPHLHGISLRRDRAFLRQIIIDARQYYPDTVMPPYGLADVGKRVAAAYQGKAVLDAASIEHLLDYLMSLK